jgi:hypothetical protein
VLRRPKSEPEIEAQGVYTISETETAANKPHSRISERLNFPVVSTELPAPILALVQFGGIPVPTEVLIVQTYTINDVRRFLSALVINEAGFLWT